MGTIMCGVIGQLKHQFTGLLSLIQWISMNATLLKWRKMKIALKWNLNSFSVSLSLSLPVGSIPNGILALHFALRTKSQKRKIGEKRRLALPATSYKIEMAESTVTKHEINSSEQQFQLATTWSVILMDRRSPNRNKQRKNKINCRKENSRTCSALCTFRHNYSTFDTFGCDTGYITNKTIHTLTPMFSESKSKASVGVMV